MSQLRDSKQEANRVQNVTLSRTIESSNSVEERVEVFDLSSPSVRFETVQLDAFYIHVDPRFRFLFILKNKSYKIESYKIYLARVGGKFEILSNSLKVEFCRNNFVAEFHRNSSFKNLSRIRKTYFGKKNDCCGILKNGKILFSSKKIEIRAA